MRLIADADLAVADGMPLIWASRLLGDPLPERVPGSGLIWDLCEDAARNGRSVLLVGGAGAAGARAAAVICRPLLRASRSAGTCRCRWASGPRNPAWWSRSAKRSPQSGADLVFVGLGFPKQERLIAALRPALPGAWFAGVGISLSFVAGEVRRAPRLGPDPRARVGAPPGPGAASSRPPLPAARDSVRRPPLPPRAAPAVRLTGDQPRAAPRSARAAGPRAGG